MVRPSLWISGVVLAIVAVACGGGGGSGPTSPTPPAPPPAPPPPVPVSGNVQGSVIGLDDPGFNFAGTEVEIIGIGGTAVNSNNEWGIDDVPPGQHRIEIFGPGHLRRKVEILVADGGVNRFDDIMLVEKAPFHLVGFDEIYRGFTVEGTIRWSKRPNRVVLDQKSLGKLDQGLGFFEAAVDEAFSGWLPANGFFKGTPVVTGGAPVPALGSFDCDDVADGEIVIVGYDFDCSEALGWESHCFRTVGNTVTRAVIWLSDCSTEATIKHEIIHTLCASHMETDPGLSLMGGGGFHAPDLTPLDMLHLRYLYGRPPGVRSPDNAWNLGVLQPQ